MTVTQFERRERDREEVKWKKNKREGKLL